MPRDIVSLQQDRAKAYANMQVIYAKDAYDDQQKEFDAASAEVETLDRDMANAERLHKLRSDKAIGTPESMGSDTEEAQAVVLPFKSFGEQLLAVHNAAKNHVVDERLNIVATIQGQNESVPSDGGFLVQRDFNQEILRRSFDVSALASKVRRIPISANANGLKINALKDDSRATGSRFGGVQVYWPAEGGTISNAGALQFRQIELDLKDLAAVVYATRNILQDTTALTALMMEAVPAEIAFTVDDSIIWGSGTGRIKGFMTTGCKVSITKETGQAARTIVYENIQKMWARMWSRSWANSAWYINQDCMPQLNAMSLVIGTGGVPVYLPPGGLSQSPFGTLMGRPVIPLEYCETLGTEGDIILADLSQYIMIDKGGIDTASSIHVEFLTAQECFRFIYRVDGQPIDNKPITPYKGTATQSPFVTLANRA
jgi:HK97 family phage major capsid protein